MNTSISDMASFPIPPLGSHWSHESDLIGDLFDLTICIIIFRCPTDGISIALVQSEAIIFKIVPIGFEIYICMLAVEPAVSHMLSPCKAHSAKNPQGTRRKGRSMQR